MCHYEKSIFWLEILHTVATLIHLQIDHRVILTNLLILQKIFPLKKNPHQLTWTKMNIFVYLKEKYPPLLCMCCCCDISVTSRADLTVFCRLSLHNASTRSTVISRVPRLWNTCRDVATWVWFCNTAISYLILNMGKHPGVHF